MSVSSTSLFLLHVFFFFNDTPTTEIYTLSLHDALPILAPWRQRKSPSKTAAACAASSSATDACRASSRSSSRSEEHTSELQSLRHLVCRLLLEKKKQNLAYGKAT